MVGTILKLWIATPWAIQHALDQEALEWPQPTATEYPSAEFGRQS